MHDSLMSHIASNFITEYENCANSSIEYLLNKYLSAKIALSSIVESDFSSSFFVSELATPKNGRPDITALDSNGRKRLIIEGKFWANLTDNQPNNYLKEISENGKILFIAPEARQLSLKNDINHRCNGNTSQIIVTSWKKLLATIERQNNKSFDNQLASDLIQLQHLCQKMDTEGMPPLSMSDLDPMHGRIATHFPDIIEECKAILKKWKFTNFKGLRATSTRYGHGLYFKAYDFACYLHFDSQKWFKRPINTPLWLSVFDNEFKPSIQIQNLINEYDVNNSIESDYGIILTPGMDKNNIIEHVTNTVKALLSSLHENI